MKTETSKTAVAGLCKWIARWLAAFVAAGAFAFVFASAKARAQTAPCSPLKSCVVERDANKTRNAVESNGLVSDPADALVDRSEGRRYWLRCWQKGVLITERITRTPPPESKQAVAMTNVDDKAMKLFDLKNATCMIEALGSD